MKKDLMPQSEQTSPFQLPQWRRGPTDVRSHTQSDKVRHDIDKNLLPISAALDKHKHNVSARNIVHISTEVCSVFRTQKPSPVVVSATTSETGHKKAQG